MTLRWRCKGEGKEYRGLSTTPSLRAAKPDLRADTVTVQQESAMAVRMHTRLHTHLCSGPVCQVLFQCRHGRNASVA